MAKGLRSFGQKGRREAGVDEAGRGCLAGPVYAAAVVIPSHFRHPLLNDSKKMKAADREELRLFIESKAQAWAVGIAEAEEIDQINILNASFLAMHRAIAQLPFLPEALLIDGNRFAAYPGVPHQCYVKGDGRFKAIAAASILAKTHRDTFMKKLALTYPQYGWERNFGYPTSQHRAAIAQFGLSPLHRRSFRSLPGQERLPLPQ